MNLGDLAQRATVTGLVGMGVSWLLLLLEKRLRRELTLHIALQIWGLWLTGAVWKSRRGDDAVSVLYTDSLITGAS